MYGDNPIYAWVDELWSLIRGDWRPLTLPQRLSQELERDVRALAWEIGYSSTLETLDVLRVLQRDTLKPYFHYRHFSKPKKDGTRRDLAEPDAALKAIQHNILKRYLQDEQVHPAAVGFRRKQSVADHVWPHAGAQCIVSADMADFFPSTTRARVQDWWRGRVPASEQAAHLLTLFTTYRGALPQGAPTSPALSNLVNFEMDRRLASLTERSGGTYTRYCDDMLFSWHHRALPPSDFAPAVQAILRTAGYRLHPRKGWQIYQAADEPQVTGVVLTRDGKVALPPAMQRLMRRLAQTDDPRAAARLQGYRGYQQMIERRR